MPLKQSIDWKNAWFPIDDVKRCETRGSWSPCVKARFESLHIFLIRRKTWIDSLPSWRRRGRKQEKVAGSRKQEAGSKKQEAGSRKQEAGSRKQEAGSREYWN